MSYLLCAYCVGVCIKSVFDGIYTVTSLTSVADEEHPPVKAGDFTEKLALLRANDDEALEDEYNVSLYYLYLNVTIVDGY